MKMFYYDKSSDFSLAKDVKYSLNIALPSFEVMFDSLSLPNLIALQTSIKAIPIPYVIIPAAAAEMAPPITN